MKRFALLLAPLILAACTTAPTVNTDTAPGTDFSSFHTYTWGAKPNASNPLASQRIVADVDAQLTTHGWTMAADGSADADVTLVAHVATTQQHTLDTYYTGGAYAGWGWRRFGGMGMGMGSTQTTVQTYNVGTLILDMFDTKSKQAVWRGTASATVPSSTKSANAKIDAAVTKMFVGFPNGSK